MKVAIITPLDLLPLSALVDDYHMVIPHLVLDDDRYTNFYRDMNGWKILDNGQADVPIEPHQLHDIARMVEADEIVVPDVMGEAHATVTAIMDFERYIDPENFMYGGVVQGKSLAEIMMCLNFILNQNWINVIYLPRVLTKIHKMQRVTLAEAIPNYARMAGRKMFIHCLGAGQWTMEILALRETGTVRGIDSSSPVALGLEGRRLDSPYKGHGPEFYNAKVDRKSTTWRIINDNVRQYLEWGGVKIPEASRSEVS